MDDSAHKGQFDPGVQRGFTLIELVMVMLIVGVLAVFVAPNVSLLSGFDEVGYRDKVRGALEFARKAAVSGRRSVKVSLSGNNLTFTADNDTPEGDAGTVGTYPRALTLPALDSRCAGVANQVCAPSNVTLAGPTSLVFNPLGQPTSTPVNSYAYTVTGKTTVTITVASETGYVY